MVPTAAVCGYYFSHPDSRYFGIGELDRDQVADHAKRKHWDQAIAERWLAPNPGYDPEAASTEIDEGQETSAEPGKRSAGETA